MCNVLKLYFNSYDIIFANTQSQSSGRGSALVVDVSSGSSNTSFYDCSFLGFQSTIYFPSSYVTAYFKGAYIEGGELG
jgi:hypothetical protein